MIEALDSCPGISGLSHSMSQYSLRMSSLTHKLERWPFMLWNTGKLRLASRIVWQQKRGFRMEMLYLYIHLQISTLCRIK
jgi:hypothetical protein